MIIMEEESKNQFTPDRANNFTIGYIDHDFNVYSRYLEPSLNSLQGKCAIIKTTDKDNPATNYNTIIEQASTNYIILTHQDISFSSNLLEKIDLTIEKVPNFGALGLVGVDSNRNYHWSTPNQLFELETLDCCFIVIQKSHGVFFDATIFDDFHLYVEDYCIQIAQKGLKIYTLLIDSNPNEKVPNINEKEWMLHHSATLSQRGACWGKYNQYKIKLNAKWGRQIKTT